MQVIEPQPPAFGDSQADYHTTVEPFYNYWLGFVTVHTFHNCDKWDTRESPDRRVKRLMQKENRKLRDARRREYTQTVRVSVYTS